MADVDDLRTYRTAAIAAIGDEDYATALTHLRKCKAMIALMPDSEFDGQSLAWHAQQIDSLIADMKAETAAASTVGIQKTEMTYAVVDDEDT